MTDLATYEEWRNVALNAGESAHAIYPRESVENELALHLLRALRELDKRDSRDAPRENGATT